jgi:hypothetical protein
MGQMDLALRVGLLSCLLLIPSFTHASDAPREKRWSAQILDTLLIGEAVWLKDKKDKKFLSLYTKAEGKPKGGILLLHDEGLHPDWPEIIFPLRTRLAEQGWSTLSLQMPILPITGAPFTVFSPILDEAPARIRSGIAFFQMQGIEHIILIGHGVGAAMGASFLTTTKNSGVDAFVGIALGAPSSSRPRYQPDPRLNTPALLEKLTLPTLDIYGALDDASVTDSSMLRASAAKKAHNKDYQQVRVPDADHFFNRYDKVLLQHVTTWLDKHPAKP